MAKKKSRKSNRSKGGSSEKAYRQHLPEELESRLRAVWSAVGSLIAWCNSGSAWLSMFCSEARPYRETFYWESIAEMIARYIEDHPGESPEAVLTDCLVATQCSPSSEDPPRFQEFRKMWSEILDRSGPEIEHFIQADLELAAQEGNYEAVAALYAADHQKSQMGDDESE